MNYLEIAGTAVGVLYLILEYRASSWLWIAGIVMPAIYLPVYYDAGLYADFGISVYYIIAAVYGLVVWLRGQRHPESGDSVPLSITRTPRTLWLKLAGVLATIFVLIGFILSECSDSTVPWSDAFTTALSIVAMWMLARKYLEQWLVWIAADLGCSALYLYKDLYFTSGLYLAYAVIALLGYRQWRRLMMTQKNV